ncbi:hypothetical protein E2562_003708 [Oryza meyeriana var. granulata]|uniref:Uncharacterized protein n=1 Tax=Oryza meyeriana var. granulata TaxID=110450 RepID=A0A6G1C4T0_9ORYZ|nr:hypothetical protein E2562_003708 [Oryza meyeriana var. granulata]
MAPARVRNQSRARQKSVPRALQFSPPRARLPSRSVFSACPAFPTAVIPEMSPSGGGQLGAGSGRGGLVEPDNSHGRRSGLGQAASHGGRIAATVGRVSGVVSSTGAAATDGRCYGPGGGAFSRGGGGTAGGCFPGTDGSSASDLFAVTDTPEP